MKCITGIHRRDANADSAVTGRTPCTVAQLRAHVIDK